MLYYGNRNIDEVYYGNRKIGSIYNGSNLLWERYNPINIEWVTTSDSIEFKMFPNKTYHIVVVGTAYTYTINDSSYYINGACSYDVNNNLTYTPTEKMKAIIKITRDDSDTSRTVRTGLYIRKLNQETNDSYVEAITRIRTKDRKTSPSFNYSYVSVFGTSGSHHEISSTKEASYYDGTMNGYGTENSTGYVHVWSE